MSARRQIRMSRICTDELGWCGTEIEPKQTPMTRRSSLLILLILSVGLFLRTMVPAGWMPSSAGAFAIEPCPAADAPIVAQAHHPGMHHRHGQAPQHDGDCAFAPLGAAVASVDVLTAPPAVVPAEHVPYAPPNQRPFATGPPAPPPPATGPPAIA